MSWFWFINKNCRKIWSVPSFTIEVSISVSLFTVEVFISVSSITVRGYGYSWMCCLKELKDTYLCGNHRIFLFVTTKGIDWYGVTGVDILWFLKDWDHQLWWLLVSYIPSSFVFEIRHLWRLMICSSALCRISGSLVLRFLPNRAIAGGTQVVECYSLLAFTDIWV